MRNKYCFQHFVFIHSEILSPTTELRNSITSSERGLWYIDHFLYLQDNYKYFDFLAKRTVATLNFEYMYFKFLLLFLLLHELYNFFAAGSQI